MITSNLLNASYPEPDVYNALSMPIYHSVAFEFDTAEEMEAAFMGQAKLYTYSRISNPTVEHFEERIKVLSNGKFVTAFASGMAAISNTFMCIAYTGANIVTTTRLFGNTFSFFKSSLEAFGVEVRFCDLLNMAEVERMIDGNTCAVFTEVLTNPHLEVPDLSLLSATAHKHGVPLIADTTLMPWTAWAAADFGVDLEIVSTTKYVSGGGTSLGGVVVDHASFDWSNSFRLKPIAHIAPQDRFNFKLRSEMMRNLGATMGPQTAYMQTIGLETLDLRFKKAAATCLALAQFLQTLPEVKTVGYTGLSTNCFHKLSVRQFGSLPGAMLTFCLENRAACYAFMNRLKRIRRATNLFDNRSLIIHPLSTIYGTLSEENKQLVNVPDGLLRLSVGLEDSELLKADILQALNKR